MILFSYFHNTTQIEQLSTKDYPICSAPEIVLGLEDLRTSKSRSLQNSVL